MIKIDSERQKQIKISDLESLIEVREENTIKNHALNIFKSDYRIKGYKTGTSLYIWRQTIWNRTFYSTFEFQFSKDGAFRKIKRKTNKGALSLLLLMALATLIFLINQYLKPDFFLSLGQLISIILSLAIITILLSFINLRQANLEVKALIEEASNGSIQFKTSEFSLKGILRRLLTYPICFLSIYISMMQLLTPEKQTNETDFIYLTAGLGICTIYLGIDIYLMFKARK